MAPKKDKKVVPVNTSNDIKRALNAKDPTPALNFNNLTLEQQQLLMSGQLAEHNTNSSSSRGSLKQQQQQQQHVASPLTEKEKAQRSEKIVNQLYELELKSDIDHECKTIFEECNSSCATIELSKEEISETRECLNKILLSHSTIESMKSELKSLLSSKLQENSSFRRDFASDLQQYKSLLNSKKDLIGRYFSLDKELVAQKTSFSELTEYERRMLEKISALEKNKEEIYAEEMEKTVKIKETIADASKQTEAAIEEFTKEIAVLKEEIAKLTVDNEEVVKYCQMQNELFPRQRDFKNTELQIINIKKAQRSEVLSRKLRLLKEKSVNCSELHKDIGSLKTTEARFQQKMLEFEKSLKTTEKYLALVVTQEVDANKALDKIIADKDYAERETADKLLEIESHDKEYLSLKELLSDITSKSKDKGVLLRELQQQRKELKVKVEELNKHSSLSFNNSNMDEI